MCGHNERRKKTIGYSGQAYAHGAWKPSSTAEELRRAEKFIMAHEPRPAIETLMLRRKNERLTTTY